MFNPTIKLSPNIKVGKDSGTKITSLIKGVVCFFQGHYVDYSIVVSSKHKAIRIAIDKGESEEKLLEMAREILVYASQQVDIAYREATLFLKEYYDLTGRNTQDCEVRICIKARRGDEIYDLYRAGDYDKKWSSYPLKENTGFWKIDDSGEYFIENNIPQAVKDERYKNKRIDKNKVSRYTPPSNFLKRINKFRKSCDDPRWVECWDTGKRRVPMKESCYKSTLIVPMTLLNNNLSETCKKKLGFNESYDKHTYGFLCFDHRDIDFFDKKIDVDIGYIVADWLSLYMVDRINYFDKSEVWTSLLEKIDDTKLQAIIEKSTPLLAKA